MVILSMNGNLYPWYYCYCIIVMLCLNTLRQRQNGCHDTDDIFKCILLNENSRIWNWFQWSIFLGLTIWQHWFRQWLGTEQVTSIIWSNVLHNLNSTMLIWQDTWTKYNEYSNLMVMYKVRKTPTKACVYRCHRSHLIGYEYVLTDLILNGNFVSTSFEVANLTTLDITRKQYKAFG